MKKYSQTNVRKNKYILYTFITLFLLFVFAGIMYYKVFSSRREKSAQNTSNTSAIEEGVNYSPPTDSEKQSGDTKKQEIDSSQTESTNQQSNQITPSKKNVSVVITSKEVIDSNLEVAGYAEGVIEKDGKCTVTFIQSNKKITQQQVALDDAQYTSCGVISVPLKRFTKGTWKVTLAYVSSKYSGTSAVESIIIK